MNPLHVGMGESNLGKRRKRSRKGLANEVGAVVGALMMLVGAWRVEARPDIVWQEPLPTVLLELSDDVIGESSGVATVTANMDFRSSVDTTVVVSATPVAPATASDFALSANRTLTIRAGDTSSTGTVTIAGVDDSVAGQGVELAVTGVAANSMGVLGPFDLQLFIEDDDTASVKVVPESLVVGEGESAPYTVALTSRPGGTVTVSVLSGPHTKFSVDKTRLTFGPENWSTAQIVTVTAVEDADAFDDHDVLVHSAAGGGYDDVYLAHVDVTASDDDHPVVTVEADVDEVIYNLPSYVFDLDDVSFTVTRKGSTYAPLEVAVTLTQDRPFLPAAALSRTVWIPVGAASAKLEIARSELTGSAAADGTLTATVAEGDGYAVGADPSADVAVRFVHTAVTVGLEKSAYRFAEHQGTAEFAVVARTAARVPAPFQIFYFALSDRAGEATSPGDYGAFSEPAELSYGDWTVAGDHFVARKVLDILAIHDDQIAEPDESLGVLLEQGPGDRWEWLRFALPDGTACGPSSAGTPCQATVTIKDNDTPSVEVAPTVRVDPSVKVDPTALSVTEEDAAGAAYTVVLAAAPTDAVTVTVTVTAGTEVRADPSSLTFTTENWGTPQTVTVTADADDDADNEEVTLTHRAAGGGYGEVEIATAAVKVTDDDTTGFVLSPDALQVTEGDSAEYMLALTAQPGGAVTVAIGATGDADLTPDPAQVSFGPDDWNTARTVTVTAVRDEDTGNDTATLTHTARGGGYDAVTADLAVTVVDPDECTLSVADARGDEQDGELVFAVNVTPPCHEPVTVNYRTEDGTAVAPTDYAPASGVLAFAAGESRKEVKTKLRMNGVDEENERFYLRLSEPRNAILGDAEAVATITNRDPMPRAWLARFGRTVADQLLAGVEERVAAGRNAGARSGLGGWDVGRSWDGYVAVEDPAAALRRRVWGDAASGNTGSMTLAEFLDRSAFALSFGNGSGGVASVWGRGSFSRFDGVEGRLSLNGEVATGTLGGDFASGRSLVGMALFHSEGEGAYRMGSAAGEVSSSLSGVYPYFSHELDRHLSVWMAGGYGIGRLTLSEDAGERPKADMDMVMGAAGVRGLLVARPGAEGFALAATAGARYVRATSERTAGIAATAAELTRIRVGLEGSYRFTRVDGTALTPSVELRLRHDAGDAEQGLGLEAGTGLDWSDPVRGMSATLKARGLVAHAADRFRDWGASGSLRYETDPSSERGLWVSVRQSYGTDGEAGPDRLLERGGPAGHGNSLPGGRLDTEAGYGFPLADGRFIGAPYVGFGLSDGTREHRLGYRLGLARGKGVAFRVRLETTSRADSGDGARPERALMLGGEMTW